MLKKILLAIATLIMTMGIAFAEVDVNKADQAALDGVKGIGPALSKVIIAERKKNGEFKDWADFQKRVKGVADKRSDALSKAGLTVNGQSKQGAAPSASSSASADAKKDAKDKGGKDKEEAKGKDKDKGASTGKEASASASHEDKKSKSKEEKPSSSASASASAPAKK